MIPWINIARDLAKGCHDGHGYVINRRRVQVGRGQFRTEFVARALPPASGGDTVVVGRFRSMEQAQKGVEQWALSKEV